MASVISTNMASLWAAKNLQGAQSKMADSVERLSSGLRINRARDDAAGLGIASKLLQQVNGANQGARNINDGISMVQTAEGALNSASEIAQRIFTLASQGKTGTQNTLSRTAIKTEMQQLMQSLNGISTRTTFAGVNLLDVTATGAPQTTAKFNIQVTSNSGDIIGLRKDAFLSIGSGTPSYTAVELDNYSATDTITVYSEVGDGTYASHTLLVGAADDESKIDGLTTDDLAIEADFFTLDSGTTGGQADSLNQGITAITVSSNNITTMFDTVMTRASSYIDAINTQRGILGALQNELEASLNNVIELSANNSAARSRVIDTDYATETSNLTKGQILQQAATAMLAQANQMPNVILSLLK